MKKIFVLLFVIVGISAVSSVSAKSMVVILVSDHMADCTVAEALAAELDATIVKTPFNAYDKSVLDDILAINPEEVIIIGGPVAVSPEYYERLIERGIDVKRIGGRTRQQTSILVYNEYRQRFGLNPIIADGRQPYGLQGRFPVWFFDNETEINSFMNQYRSLVLNYGRAMSFAHRARYGILNVTDQEVENFGLGLQQRMRTQYGNHTWVRTRMRGHGMPPWARGRR